MRSSIQRSPILGLGLAWYVVLMLVLLASCTGGDAQIARPAEFVPARETVAVASPTPETEPAAAESGLNLLIDVQGNVLLKRRAWSDYYRTDFGSELHRGDLVRVAGDSMAMVLCDGLTTWEIPTGTTAGLNSGCPPPQEAILIRGGVLVGNTRGGSDPLIPYIISPRKTKVLNLAPTLRWNADPFATGYTVTVTGSGFKWTSTVPESAITYPGDPPLLRGMTYAMVVESDSGASSDDENVQGIGFTILDEAAAARATENVERIESLGLEPHAKGLVLSQYLVGEGLFAEAIEVLEALVLEESDFAALYRMLGDLYRQAGLTLLARENYEIALELADESQNLETSAMARAGLAEVLLTLGDREQAAGVLHDAISLYQTLGDSEQVSLLQARLE